MPTFLPGHHGTSFHSCLSPSMLCLEVQMGSLTPLRAGGLSDLVLMSALIWFFSANLASVHPGHWVSIKKLPSTWLEKHSLVPFCKGWCGRWLCLPRKFVLWTWRPMTATWNLRACSFWAAIFKKVLAEIQEIVFAESSCLQVGRHHGRLHY